MEKFYLVVLIFCMSISWSCAHKPSQLPPSQQILDDPAVEQSYKDAIRQKRVIPGMAHGMVEAIYCSERGSILLA